jgi:hypothetical protein
VFRQRVKVAELPVVLDQQLWSQLPSRPGSEPARLTIVGD